MPDPNHPAAQLILRVTASLLSEGPTADVRPTLVAMEAQADQLLAEFTSAVRALLDGPASEEDQASAEALWGRYFSASGHLALLASCKRILTAHVRGDDDRCGLAQVQATLVERMVEAAEAVGAAGQAGLDGPPAQPPG
jgi:hypothetical protein